MSACNSRPDLDINLKNTPNKDLAMKYALYVTLFNNIRCLVNLCLDIVYEDKSVFNKDANRDKHKDKFEDLLKRLMYTIITLQTGTKPHKLFTKGVAYSLNIKPRIQS